MLTTVEPVYSIIREETRIAVAVAVIILRRSQTTFVWSEVGEEKATIADDRGDENQTQIIAPKGASTHTAQRTTASTHKRFSTCFVVSG